MSGRPQMGCGSFDYPNRTQRFSETGDTIKETKTISGTPETRAAMHEVMAAFQAFEGANDALLAELKNKASVVTLLEEKVARIDAAVGRHLSPLPTPRRRSALDP